ncbi:hypothetical protein ACFLS1_04345 [Verrucomicrobiota bacterium]
MKKIFLIMFLLTLCMAADINAGGGEYTYTGRSKKWFAEVKKLGTRLESEGSVLFYVDGNVGNYHYISATLKQISDSPTWNPANTLLPLLSLEKALTITEKELKKTNKAYDNFRLIDSTLSKCNTNKEICKNKWKYILKFRGTSRTHHDRTFLASVLMDGTILKPHIVGWSSTDKAKDSSPDITDVKELPATRKKTEERLSSVIVPELDFRQANVYDIIEVLEDYISEYGNEIEKNEKTQIHLKVHKSVSPDNNLPYALPIHTSLIAFHAKKMSIWEALKLTAQLGQLKLHTEGNVVTIYDPKK